MSELASVGQHFMLGLRPTTSLHPLDRALLRDLKPAGVVLFKSNFPHDLPYRDWLKSHAELIADIREAVGRERLFIAIDHEGGRVCRTPPPITRYAYARHWGDTAGDVGAAMGTELASLGINLNFAPSLDIDSNPDNPVIGARSFARDAETVTARGLAFLERMEKSGVRGCAKHFPGHGDTRTDSHYDLPVIDAPPEVLRERELAPFKAAIISGIGMVMTSHILFRAFDASLPATLSERIVTGLLREEFGFGGVVVSDDIGMNAISALFNDQEAAVRFLAAGNDMLTICSYWTDTERARGLARAIIDARRSGALDRRALEESHARIEAMLAQTAQHGVRELAESAFQTHAAAGPLFQSETAEIV
jgi:beta-N-acetylhexosaminidase